MQFNITMESGRPCRTRNVGQIWAILRNGGGGSGVDND